MVYSNHSLPYINIPEKPMVILWPELYLDLQQT